MIIISSFGFNHSWPFLENMSCSSHGAFLQLDFDIKLLYPNSIFTMHVRNFTEKRDLFSCLSSDIFACDIGCVLEPVAYIARAFPKFLGWVTRLPA